MEISIVLVGFSGGVGKSFLQLLKKKKGYLLNKYGLEIVVTTVMNSTSVYQNSNGLMIERLISGSYPREFKSRLTAEEVVKECNAEILIDAGPTNIKTGEPGLSLIKAAIKNGMHIITLDKGPLVLAYQELKTLASKNDVQLKLSGATGAALPTADIGLYSLAGAKIEKISGILTGTVNYILTRMHNQKGLTYEEALEEAKEKGIAESDSRLDVEGWDTAVKTVILANVIMDVKLSINDFKVEGITSITPEDIKLASQEGKVLKLIGEARIIRDEVYASVSLQKIPQDSLLARVSGPVKGVQFLSDIMGEVLILGGESSPMAAAASALKDLINLTTTGNI